MTSKPFATPAANPSCALPGLSDTWDTPTANTPTSLTASAGARRLRSARLMASVTVLALAACTSVNRQPADPPAQPPSPTVNVPIAVGEAAGSLPPLPRGGQVSAPTVSSLEVPRDIWERIRRGYAIPNLDNEVVRDKEKWYRSKPDYLERMSDRSRKYIYHIVEELERRQMPSELALLPFVESAFNPQAVSSAKASGMWQFMAGTGKDFALKQNILRDDRRDVLASTRAALDYLQRLYSMFGDWHLALAAYNWGQGNVQRAILKNQRAGMPTGYWDLNMPLETRQYVPKLQAIKNIVSSNQPENPILPDVHNHPYFQSVPITKDIDVALAAKLADVSLADFHSLNPSQKKPVILAAGTPQILLPWENAIVFQQNLEAHGAGRQATWTAVVLNKTARVSEVAREYGMNEAEFRRINNIPPRMLLKAGSTVMVTRSETRHADVPAQVADNAQMALAPEMVLRRLSVKARKGDTAATVAARHHLTAANVMKWNGIGAGKRFKPGQAVTIYQLVPATDAHPHSDEPKAAPVQAAASSSSATTASAGRGQAHTKGRATPAPARPGRAAPATKPAASGRAPAKHTAPATKPAAKPAPKKR